MKPVISSIHATVLPTESPQDAQLPGAAVGDAVTPPNEDDDSTQPAMDEDAAAEPETQALNVDRGTVPPPVANSVVVELTVGRGGGG
eukprot:COSAG01_NODE_31665_length_593_cov_1.435223_1_plen_86_part_01